MRAENAEIGAGEKKWGHSPSLLLKDMKAGFRRRELGTWSLVRGEVPMINRRIHVQLLSFVVLIGETIGCQRETPTEKTQPPQPASSVDHAAEQTVDAIITPMDKARGVEGTLEKSAERTADRVKETAP